MGRFGRRWPSVVATAFMLMVIAILATPATGASLDVSIESWQSAIQRRVENWFG